MPEGIRFSRAAASSRNRRARDLALGHILQTFAGFGAQVHLDCLAVAVFDHGAAPTGFSDRIFRFNYLRDRLIAGAGLAGFAFMADAVPEAMTRLRAVVDARLQRALDVVEEVLPAAREVLAALFDRLLEYLGIRERIVGGGERLAGLARGEAVLGSALAQRVGRGVGATVTLTADERIGQWQFDHWEGAGVATPNAATTNVSMSASRDVTPVYRLVTPRTLSVAGGTGTGTYVNGDVVPIAAVVPDGYRFVRGAWMLDGPVPVLDPTRIDDFPRDPALRPRQWQAGPVRVAPAVPVLLTPSAASLEDAYQQIQVIGQATGHGNQAGAMVQRMRTDIADIVAKTPKPPQPMTYFHEVSPDLYTATAQSFVGNVYSLFGMVNIADPAGGPFPQLSQEHVVQANPNLIFAADTKCCGVNAAAIAARPGWHSIDAVKRNHVVELDDDLAGRWGPRVVDLVRAISDAVGKAQRG